MFVYEFKIIRQFHYKIVVIQIVHHHRRLRIESAATVTTFVVGARVLLNPQKVCNFEHSGLMQNAVGIFGDFANSRLFSIHLNAGKEFGKPFLEPGVHLHGEIAVHQLVGILMKDHGPWVLDRQIQQDKTAIIVSQEQARHFRRLAVPERCELSKFFCIAESHDLKRHGETDVGLGQQRAEYPTHLLKAHGHIAATFLASIGDNREMRRFHLDPL